MLSPALSFNFLRAFSQKCQLFFFLHFATCRYCIVKFPRSPPIFISLISLLVSVVKVTELKSLANHVVVGSVSCEMLDLFCPLPQTLAVDINDLGTVKLNLEVTWRYLDLQPFIFCNFIISTCLFRCLFCSVSHSLFCFFFPLLFSPFDKDDQTSSTSTVSKRLLSNQSPPDTPSMREQVFYVSHIKRDIPSAFSTNSITPLVYA